MRTLSNLTHRQRIDNHQVLPLPVFGQWRFSTLNPLPCTAYQGNHHPGLRAGQQVHSPRPGRQRCGAHGGGYRQFGQRGGASAAAHAPLLHRHHLLARRWGPARMNRALGNEMESCCDRNETSCISGYLLRTHLSFTVTIFLPIDVTPPACIEP